MRKKSFKPISLLLTLTVILAITGCIDRTEEITIAENGETTILAKFEGEGEGFKPPVALPSAPEWTYLTDTANFDRDRIDFKAEIVIPYGQPLPETYAKVKNGEDNINLRFPTEVKYWRDGNRTYYEFKRTYQARKYIRYNYMADEEMDKELEKRVTDEGIFNLSEEDRQRYISKLADSFTYFHYMIFSDVLGELVMNRTIFASIKKTLEKKARTHIEGIITPELVLDILGRDDDEMSEAIDELNVRVENEIVQLYKKEIGGSDKTKNERFEEVLEKTKTDYEITQKLGASQFVVLVIMPGEIISTNGLTDPDEPFSVGWIFKGSEMHDKNIPMYALSVVEHE